MRAASGAGDGRGYRACVQGRETPAETLKTRVLMRTSVALRMGLVVFTIPTPSYRD